MSTIEVRKMRKSVSMLFLTSPGCFLFEKFRSLYEDFEFILDLHDAKCYHLFENSYSIVYFFDWGGCWEWNLTVKNM